MVSCSGLTMVMCITEVLFKVSCIFKEVQSFQEHVHIGFSITPLQKDPLIQSGEGKVTEELEPSRKDNFNQCYVDYKSYSLPGEMLCLVDR